MELSIEFLRIFFSILIFYTAPIFIFQIGIMSLLWLLAGKIEGWSTIDSIYWTCITATTVGYGDIKPTKTSTKILAILITILGLIFTGLFVAIAVESAQQAFIWINGENVDI